MSKEWDDLHPVQAREYQRRRRKKNRAWMDSIKSKPCKVCKCRFPPECMDWDHVRGKKLFHIGNNINFGMKRLLAEIAKCDLICSNCHRVRTRRRKRCRLQ